MNYSVSLRISWSQNGGKDPSGIDGVVCFGGEDWWYHNRGHYDIQMMRQAAKRLPVLYINSIGVRNHRVREGRVFLARVKRKLKSVLRGMVRVEPGFSVYSPLTTPGIRRSRLGRRFTALQIRAAMRKAGIRNALLWVAVPTAQELLEFIPHRTLIYQRTDRFEEFAPERAEVGAQARSETQSRCGSDPVLLALPHER